MKKTIYLLLFLIIPAISFAQERDIPNNIYDKADENIRESNAFKREKWFYEQRMFPYNSIPTDAYKKALEQRDELRKKNGFYFKAYNDWINIGPKPGYYFSYGNISGRITSVKIDPSNPNVMYLGAAFGGVWKSTDAGLSWLPKTDYEVSLSTGAIAIDPANTNIIYYGTGEATYSGASYYGRGILKSTDAGNTWTSYTDGLPAQTYFSRIIVKPGNSNLIFAAAGTSGLYKSTNAGVNWIIAVSGRCDDVVCDPTGNNIYIIGSTYRKSTDGGTTFTQYTNTLGTRNHLAICRTSPDVLYYCAYAGSNITAYKSTNAGLNFTQVGVGTNFSGGQGWYDLYMHVNPFDPNIAYVGSIDIWQTTDGGASFANITNSYASGTVHPDQHNMEFHPTDPNICYCANDGGIWKSTNKGTNWTNLNSTLAITQFYRIAADPSNAAHIMGGTQDNGSQRTLGTINWTAGFGGDGGEVCFHTPNNQYMLGETQNNGVMRSGNGGTSWANATIGLTGSGVWVAPLLSHPDSLGIFYTARAQVFKTINYGASWFAISSGTTGSLEQMTISKTNPMIMYASRSNILYQSTDGGYTFKQRNIGISRTISSVNIHPDSSNVVIVTFSGFGAGKIYKTTNGAASWVGISGDLPDVPVNDGMIYYPGTSTSVYLVATDVGVFMSNNWGNKWVEVASGLPNTVSMHLDYHSTTNKLRIGTHGRGVYEISGLVGVINQSSSVPEGYSLGQNFPNPFNPATLIKYSIKDAGNVKLRVYDLLGREIQTLVNEYQKPGEYTAQFSANSLNLSSGVYIYKLETDKFTDSKKMLMIK